MPSRIHEVRLQRCCSGVPALRAACRYPTGKIDLRADGAAEEADALLAETVSDYELILGAVHPMTEAAASGSRLNWDFDPPPI